MQEENIDENIKKALSQYVSFFCIQAKRYNIKITYGMWEMWLLAKTYTIVSIM